ncbi:uncharacterized protein LOC124605492 isoform X1 [Schistocerca americana]|uniref:uncharacterized protein LOC124605492 isoform X1 n=1 Tax=Schistocerca americana TaxID=7009 RepID=UPI001F4F2144|nr:uncharacterized protein LOC124605492 isoform X1 [Schistocerca americana]
MPLLTVHCLQRFPGSHDYIGWTVDDCKTVALSVLGCCGGLELTAYISQGGLHGHITFRRYHADNRKIHVHTSLQTVNEVSKWSWRIHKFPVYYSTLQDRCNDEKLGPVLLNLDDTIGLLEFPVKNTSDLLIPTDLISLTGEKGLWGRSLLIFEEGYRIHAACGTISVSDQTDEKLAEAKFYSPVAGSVFMRWIGSLHSDSIDALIHTNLYWVTKEKGSPEKDTKHHWKIYATDILDAEAGKTRSNCNFLQFVFNPASAKEGQTVGDIDKRLGKVQISGSPDSNVINTYHDSELTSVPFDLTTGQRSLYIVIFDSKHPDSFLACARIRQITPYTQKVIMQSEGVSGEVTFSQRSPFDPTWLHFNLSSYNDKFLGRPFHLTKYRIHELPPPSFFAEKSGNRCFQTGNVYNPTDINPDDGSASQDTYGVGDLSGKHNMWREEQTFSDLNGRYWDIYLPLQGPYSVAHRSLVLYKDTKNESNPNEIISLPWICGTLSHYQEGKNKWKEPMFTAAVIYRYPIVGRIVFRQPKDKPWADTTVIVEYLIHADGTSQNNTEEHRWMVHDLPPGKDFYNWTGRCLSAGHVYNPFEVNLQSKNSESPCTLEKSGYCRVGELSIRHGTLSIAGRKSESNKLTCRLYTDTHLPLSGPGSILGRSLVIYDDHGPKARGERLACSPITAVYRRKAVVKDWFGNGLLPSIKGKLEYFQQTEYDITDIEANIEGLEDTNGFHIHVVPVDPSLEFPCEASSLYDYYNPYNVSLHLSPAPATGTTDQYQMGDLSGKFGTLDGLTSLNSAFNDTHLPLFGPYSIIGRSVVIHKKNKNHRWACSSIERGYSPSEARELRAIASFHHPLGFAYGYIRMTQLIYNDGSKSDTVIEVNLRHPGKNDRNVTRNHNWAIYVNPVGVDASVKVLNTRCVAGGYMWNPYYTQLADPLNEELYRQECGPDNPLRCYVGDISGRLSTIDLGDKRKVFSDVNFPLEGDVSAIGRSIVIMNKDRGSERFACANIEPDKDIIKYANIQKPPKFVLAQFIEDVREVMGVPEWMLNVDSRRTKILHSGACIQFLLHFKGPIANQLEQDFSRLLGTGRLAAPSLYIPGYVPSSKRKTQLSYRQCGASDPLDKTRSKSSGVTHKDTICITFLLLFVSFSLF